VKGRVKKKSIKAASHSGWGLERKLSRMGKKQKKGHSGVDATFIGRSKCLKKLGISIRDFRRLCILKGIYPREPRGRTPGKKKGQVFYHIKDLRAIAHEPVLEKFREFKGYMKKVRKAAGRDERDEARRLDSAAPKYTLHHMVKERYPRFRDALEDLDDALTLVHLFAALPSERKIKSNVTKKAREIVRGWGAYVAATNGLTKSFVSVKGVFMEASVQGATVRWIVPHAFTHALPTDVDYRVMLTFFEFYDTLLGFVLFKLYGDMGIKYPIVAEESGGAAAGDGKHLTAVLNLLNRKDVDGAIGDVVTAAVGDDENKAEPKAPRPDKKNKKKANKLLRSLGTALDTIAKDDDSDNDESDAEMDDDSGGEEGAEEIAAPLRAALDSLEGGGQDADAPSAPVDDQAQTRKNLFAGLTFFLSREVPRGYLEVICVSFGGKVGWDGPGSPFGPANPEITHHVIDRPVLPADFDEYPKSREYVQPQWALDCANYRLLLPCGRYGVGASLPPHLSPWADEADTGYTPAYADEVERIRKGLPPIVPASDEEEEEEVELDDAAVHAKELAEEVGGDQTDEEEEKEEENFVAAPKGKKRTKEELEEEEQQELARGMMNKKAARLYGRMQHGIEKKKKAVDTLTRKRREIEASRKADDRGRTVNKQKVDRLKLERRDLEDKYSNTGGSMKKAKRRRS